MNRRSSRVARRAPRYPDPRAEQPDFQARGTTQVTGSAAMTKTAAVAAVGTTQTTGTAEVDRDEA